MPKSHINKIIRAFRSSDKNEGEPVVVDFLPENGNMFINIHNEIDVGVRNVKISFNQNLTGARGRALNDLNVFKNLTYLAAGREIEIFAGRADHFISMLKNKKVVVSVSLMLPDNKKTKYSIEHNLSIYTDLPQIINE